MPVKTILNLIDMFGINKIENGKLVDLKRLELVSQSDFTNNWKAYIKLWPKKHRKILGRLVEVLLIISNTVSYDMHHRSLLWPLNVGIGWVKACGRREDFAFLFACFLLAEQRSLLAFHR